ncbi:hypothetical protein KQ944_18370 [Bacillus subtilis]|uniref:hypothetical protein n=1 Tax=Pseudochrobactrum asaccharolyticum TaxID=354351 RepID=UPI001F45B04C|nr:hypothetical protein [Pseudochrobactrum asaccharolyticum]MCF7647315.1 hypothetical protein [Pseudochrobactrum asaccharolyticum]MCF7673606.1 hypothetical protein [Bacillus subtilis]
MNKAFSKYVTGSAFRIDLTAKMVFALISALQGKSINTGHWGAVGLINRGLMEVIDAQDKAMYKDLRLTEAGKKVAELCSMAGLGDAA